MDKLIISHESQRMNVGTDPDRNNLAGIWFNCKNVIASNGHYLIMRKKSEGEPSNQIIRLNKVKKKGMSEFHKIESDYVNKEGTTAQVLDGEYPDIQPILSSLSKKTIKLAINPRYLYEIAQAAGIEKEYQAMVTLEIPLPDDGEPHVSRGITLTAGDLVGIMMPMRTDAKPHQALEKLTK